MLDHLRIEGFRTFEKYTVADLGRVNLLVGRNNSGKTTILEAAEMLLFSEGPSTVVGCALRRGEMYVQREYAKPGRYVDAGHLFHGHTIEVETRFRISGSESGSPLSLVCQIEPWEGSPRAEPSLSFEMDDRAYADEQVSEPLMSLSIRHSSQEQASVLPMTISGGVPLDSLVRTRPSSMEKPVSFVRTEALDSVELREFWNAIALTEEEANVTENLRILESRIERIAFLSTRPARYGTSSEGIYLRLRDVEGRIPLGSLGDGIRHLLTLSLAVSRSRQGFVMIDEIDTGLHHSVMADMWRVLIAAAQRLNVQVFATTHSLDCVRSLAWLADTQSELCRSVRMHRVDSERPGTIVYGPDEISIAAEQHVELRG